MIRMKDAVSAIHWLDVLRASGAGPADETLSVLNQDILMTLKAISAPRPNSAREVARPKSNGGAPASVAHG